jgi:hypothetical protein
MPLTDKQIRNPSALAGRVVKLSDGEGLRLGVSPSGSKLWNLACRFDGKQRKLAIGPCWPSSRRVSRPGTLDGNMTPSSPTTGWSRASSSGAGTNA